MQEGNQHGTLGMYVACELLLLRLRLPVCVSWWQSTVQRLLALLVWLIRPHRFESLLNSEVCAICARSASPIPEIAARCVSRAGMARRAFVASSPRYGPAFAAVVGRDFCNSRVCVYGAEFILSDVQTARLACMRSSGGGSAPSADSTQVEAVANCESLLCLPYCFRTLWECRRLSSRWCNNFVGP